MSHRTAVKARLPHTMDRKASVVWKGARDGTGTLTTESGVLFETQYSFRARFGQLVAFAMAGVLAITALSDVPMRGGIGDRTYQPVSRAELRRNYRLAIGQMTVDLSSITFDAETATHVDATVGVGHLVVRVPSFLRCGKPAADVDPYSAPYTRNYAVKGPNIHSKTSPSGRAPKESAFRTRLRREQCPRLEGALHQLGHVDAGGRELGAAFEQLGGLRDQVLHRPAVAVVEDPVDRPVDQQPDVRADDVEHAAGERAVGGGQVRDER